jgi:hypothetical protein
VGLGGFILLDWLLAGVLLAMLTIGALRLTARELEREEINSVALQLSAWVQINQTAAMQLPLAGTRNSAGCQVTFIPAPDGAAAGEVIAFVTTMQDPQQPTLCNPEPVFRLPSGRSANPGVNSQPQVSITLLGDGSGTFTFTPRGTVTATQTLDVVIRHLGQSRAARCVRINGITGGIELGSENSGIEETCRVESFTDLL